MRRAALTTLVDMDPERFNVLRRRDQLPFVGAAESDGGWQDFSLQDAFKLRMMLDLMEGSGLGPAEAKSVLHGASMIDVHHAADAAPELWFGEFIKPGGEFGGHLGPLSQLAERLDQPGRASRVVLVNASRAARAILARAAELGIAD